MLRRVGELTQWIRQACGAHSILASISVGVQAQVIQLGKLLVLKILLQTMACSSWPWDTLVELLRLIQRVELLSGCICVLQILQVHRGRSLLWKDLSEVEAIHAVHGAQTQILQSGIYSIMIKLRQATGQVPAKIHACILLLRGASDQGLVQEVLLSPTRCSSKNGLISY